MIASYFLFNHQNLQYIIDLPKTNKRLLLCLETLNLQMQFATSRQRALSTQDMVKFINNRASSLISWD